MAKDVHPNNVTIDKSSNQMEIVEIVRITKEHKGKEKFVGLIIVNLDSICYQMAHVNIVQNIQGLP